MQFLDNAGVSRDPKIFLF